MRNSLLRLVSQSGIEFEICEKDWFGVMEIVQEITEELFPKRPPSPEEPDEFHQWNVDYPDFCRWETRQDARDLGDLLKSAIPQVRENELLKNKAGQYRSGDLSRQRHQTLLKKFVEFCHQSQGFKILEG